MSLAHRAVCGLAKTMGSIGLWIAASAPLAPRASAGPPKPDIAITDATLVDVEQGRTIGPRTVVVAGGRIVAIDRPSRAHIPPAAQRIDGRGAFVIPGLVDMHVHLFNNASHRAPNTWAFPLFVANGVTSVREMAGTPESMETVKAWRKAMAEGALVAPRIVAAGVVAWGPSPDEATRQVDAAAASGADFVKVFSDISAPTWRAIVAASRRRSLPLIGHVPAGISAVTAADAGQRSDEHLMQLFEACSTIERQVLDERRGLAGAALIAKSDDEESRVLAAYDQGACDRVAAQLAGTHQVQVPTLVLPFVEMKPASSDPQADPRWRYLRADERARWLRIEKEFTPAERAVAAQRWPVARRIVATLHRAGLTLLAGTDAPMPYVYPGFSLHEELERLTDAGLSPAEALRAATLAPAKFLGIDREAGSIAVGQRADLVVLDANPLTDIRNARRIRAVVLDGRPFPRADLDAMLDAAAREAGAD